MTTMPDEPHPAEKDLRIPAEPRDLIRAVLKGKGTDKLKPKN